MNRRRSSVPEEAFLDTHRSSAQNQSYDVRPLCVGQKENQFRNGVSMPYWLLLHKFEGKINT